MHARSDDVTHQPDCDTGRHTDPSAGCATPIVDTCGITTHIAYDDDGRPEGAVLDTRIPLPRILTAAACLEVAARFTALAQRLQHAHW